MNILFPFFRALALSGLNLNRSDSRCIFFVYDARMRSAVSSLGESIGLLLRVIDDRDPMPLRTCAAKQTAAAPTAQRTVLFRGRPNELHGWIKTASCHVLRWQNLTWSTKNIWRGRGMGTKCRRRWSARQAGSSFGSTPLRAFSRIARSLTERPRPRAGIRAMH